MWKKIIYIKKKRFSENFLKKYRAFLLQRLWKILEKKNCKKDNLSGKCCYKTADGTNLLLRNLGYILTDERNKFIQTVNLSLDLIHGFIFLLFSIVTPTNIESWYIRVKFSCVWTTLGSLFVTVWHARGATGCQNSPKRQWREQL